MSNKNNKLTAEQKQAQKTYARMQSVIHHATKGQQLLRPGSSGYSDFQKAAYRTYQSQIDAATARMEQLKREHSF